MYMTLFEILAGLIYLLGYTLVSLLSFIRNEGHWWGYLIITLAALIHIAVVVVRSIRDRRRGG